MFNSKKTIMCGVSFAVLSSINLNAHTSYASQSHEIDEEKTEIRSESNIFLNHSMDIESTDHVQNSILPQQKGADYFDKMNKALFGTRLYQNQIIKFLGKEDIENAVFSGLVPPMLWSELGLSFNFTISNRYNGENYEKLITLRKLGHKADRIQKNIPHIFKKISWEMSPESIVPEILRPQRIGQYYNFLHNFSLSDNALKAENIHFTYPRSANYHKNLYQRIINQSGSVKKISMNLFGDIQHTSDDFFTIFQTANPHNISTPTWPNLIHLDIPLRPKALAYLEGYQNLESIHLDFSETRYLNLDHLHRDLETLSRMPSLNKITLSVDQEGLSILFGTKELRHSMPVLDQIEGLIIRYRSYENKTLSQQNKKDISASFNNMVKHCMPYIKHFGLYFIGSHPVNHIKTDHQLIDAPIKIGAHFSKIMKKFIKNKQIKKIEMNSILMKFNDLESCVNSQFRNQAALAVPKKYLSFYHRIDLPFHSSAKAWQVGLSLNSLYQLDPSAIKVNYMP